MRKKNEDTPKNTYRKKPEEKKGKDDLKGNELKIKNVVKGLKDQRYRRIFGLLLIISALYLFLAFTSYLFHWKDDDSHLADKVFNFSLLFDVSVVAKNLMGRMGAVTAHLFIKKWFGISSFLFPFIAFVVGVKLAVGKSLFPFWRTVRYSFFILIWVSLTMGFLFTSNNLTLLGGTFGYEMNQWLNGLLGKIGTGFLVLFSIASFLIIVYNLNQEHFRMFLSRFGRKENVADPEDSDTEDEEDMLEQEDYNEPGLPEEEEEDTLDESDLIRKILVNGGKDSGDKELEIVYPSQSETEVKPDTGRKEPEMEIVLTGNGVISNSNYQPVDDPSSRGNEELIPELGDYDPTLDLPHYMLPPLSLLDDHGSQNAPVAIQINRDELEANKIRILETLKNYSIEIDKIKANVGPTVTLYEIIPAAGVRISKIRNLEDDIALSLSALGIRIIAPIPGRGTIGIEVPNSKPEIVSMKSILSHEKFQNSTMELPIALGKTIANETYITDLTKMPHLLMAGATGQGKSVGLNAILTSLLYKKHPAYVKFVLVDPKKVELTLFSKIERHYLAKLPDAAEAIITDTRKVVRTLNSLCVEMDSRYDLLKDAQVRTIKEYNAKFISRRLNPEHGHRFLPYIILFIDEFADLIMTAGKEIELPIARLAQLARAIGIHLIIATQRPSVNIITGMIKANFPARIAFRVTSKIDSRTILDTGGADQLIGRGDMLLSTGSDLLRLQCAFIDTPEIDRLTEYIGSQRAYPTPFMLPEVADEEGGEIEDFDPSERDDMFEDAARIIVATQQGSTSLLQRKLKLGYNRAGRIIDQLEAAGIVGPFEGSKAREVKIKDEVTLEQILKGHQRS
jgi:DNA segregation ATPase FtsK/SpoIIIE, S-DNA-T family